ncbi:phosphoribosylformylglycinamidine synthase [Sphaerochaeta sp. PS]|uniref:phosphoribosylformylglycinamidine synthase n=1 Tax=Sphaerochaeta sp. PS TaxID=3076336 RepID=UPI0028A2ECDE|nr:phosphoribosylformylglycinamidine synthase [Sphaerochaeta sp. PS]MDT4761334.1 phosphoribosylformylglycinamidine synthase [Sphaerochaeta sp. PS]
MVHRLFVEKKEGFRVSEAALFEDLQLYLGISSLKGVRLVNRYDIQGIDTSLLERCKHTVFSEIQVDTISDTLPEVASPCFILGVEYLPGQYDQRSDSAAQCIQLISGSERPFVRSARIYLLEGSFSEEEKLAIRGYLINPVDSCESRMELPEELSPTIRDAPPVETLTGFTLFDDERLGRFSREEGLAMDEEDLKLVRSYFAETGRDPTHTELKVLDTYWSDHCRHTTFLTTLDRVQIEDEEICTWYERYRFHRKALGVCKPESLMDLATIGAKALKKAGKLPRLDESEEINACSVKVDVDRDGKEEPWLLLFKNETHNHPTEIEPFGGAATCIGGAIRDPLSGRAYVFQAMRISGAASPLGPVGETLAGKIAQKKLVVTAANGNSSYGNQIGLATGLVQEIYHPGFVAKHMELGAVVGAVPAGQVVREVPQPGDLVVLVGGRTGRDGCGGATGSSKSHTMDSLASCGSEVQKGNAPEERKLQRLMRRPEASRLIKRCNDFGAGGVCVAIGELADGLSIDLDAVLTKYEGLGGTELAISESQERMAVVLQAENVEAFQNFAREENLESSVVARVTEEPALVMFHQGEKIVEIRRSFLDSHGSEKHATVVIPKREPSRKVASDPNVEQRLLDLMGDLNVCSQQGLGERFDSTIGSGSLFMPYGGTYQVTPSQVMAALFPVGNSRTNTASVMAWGYDPFLMEEDPFGGAFSAVVHSVAKLVASGADLGQTYLSFQEYFGKVGDDPLRWGLPFAALLGAFKAQMLLEKAAIGGKDSMSGSFGSLDVPPTLVSFAVSASPAQGLISCEFKGAGHQVVLLEVEREEDIPALFGQVSSLIGEGKVAACYATGFGGIAEALVKMCLGNRIGFSLQASLDLFSKRYGSFVLELTEPLALGTLLGYTTEAQVFLAERCSLPLATLQAAYEEPLERVYPRKRAETEEIAIPNLAWDRRGRVRSSYPKASPKVLIPVFPGTNCEYDLEHALYDAGASCETFVINNLSPQGVRESVVRFAKALSSAQILFLPGGFSGGDEPDGSGKFIAAFLRNPLIAEEIELLLGQRDGLVGGICNGFQALVKLGLLPYGKMLLPTEDDPTLSFNLLARHQSMLVRTRVASTLSPWMGSHRVGDISLVPISHGEGRFICKPEVMDLLVANGQVASQYVDLEGKATMALPFNPNGSAYALEALSSADGRVFGRMAHSERATGNLYRNTPYRPDDGLFVGAVAYFS